MSRWIVARSMRSGLGTGRRKTLLLRPLARTASANPPAFRGARGGSLTPTYALDGFERRMLFRLSLFIGPRVQFPLPGSIIPGSLTKWPINPRRMLGSRHQLMRTGGPRFGGASSSWLDISLVRPPGSDCFSMAAPTTEEYHGGVKSELPAILRSDHEQYSDPKAPPSGGFRLLFGGGLRGHHRCLSFQERWFGLSNRYGLLRMRGCRSAGGPPGNPDRHYAELHDAYSDQLL